MTGRRIYSLETVRRAALGLDYVSRRQLFAMLADGILDNPPIYQGRPAAREDVAECLIADIRAILAARSPTGNAGALCADHPHAERAQRVYGAERGPHRRRFP
jgi:hypothetical protein